jgi:hypothetical protein
MAFVKGLLTSDSLYCELHIQVFNAIKEHPQSVGSGSIEKFSMEE